jgi:hypothetical protein
MGFLKAVARGDYGVRFSPPETFERLEDSHSGVTLRDQSSGFELQLGWCSYRLDLTPAHETILRQDVARQTRELHLQFCRFRTAAAPDRSENPGWSPMIEAERVNIGGAPALWVLHRPAHEPGCEIVMGHLLIPLACGTFEFRAIAACGLVGARDSSLASQMRAPKPAAAPEFTEGLVLGARVPNCGDPARDEQSSDDPLAIVRRAQWWLREEAAISVVAPAVAPATGEVAIPSMHCALTPPPRYLLHQQNEERAQFSRLSFATTDGISLLTIAHFPFKSGAPGGKSSRALGGSTARAVAREASYQNAAAFMGFAGDDYFPARTVLRMFQDSLGEVWLAMIGTSQSVPENELSQELEAVVRSFRRAAIRPPGRVG